MSHVSPEDALDLPALEPPNGITPDFENPSNGNGYAYISLGICVCLSTVVFGIRIYTRFFILKMPHLGDYTLIAAWATYISFTGVCYALVESLGFFVHQWDLKMRDFIEYERFNMLLGNTTLVFIPLLKAAICLEWVQLFSPSRTRNFVFWSSWVVLWLNVIFFVIGIILLNTSCVPYERIWNPLIPGTCINIDVTLYQLIGAIFNLVTDIALLVIPQRVIWGLHLSRKQRLGVSAMFTTGLVACTAASFRIAYSLRRIGAQDFTYTIARVIVCGIAEGVSGILVMCLPALPKFFNAICTGYLSSSIPSWSVLRHFKRSRQSTQSSWPASLELEHMGNRRVRLPSNAPSDRESSVFDESPQSEEAVTLETTRFETGETYNNVHASER